MLIGGWIGNIQGTCPIDVTRLRIYSRLGRDRNQQEAGCGLSDSKWPGGDGTDMPRSGIPRTTEVLNCCVPLMLMRVVDWIQNCKMKCPAEELSNF